jgi:hypothetical protein
MCHKRDPTVLLRVCQPSLDVSTSRIARIYVKKTFKGNASQKGSLTSFVYVSQLDVSTSRIARIYLNKSQGGRARSDFNLAWLEAA